MSVQNKHILMRARPQDGPRHKKWFQDSIKEIISQFHQSENHRDEKLTKNSITENRKAFLSRQKLKSTGARNPDIILERKFEPILLLLTAILL